MKSKSEIQEQIRKLRGISDSPSEGTNKREMAACAVMVLTWAIGEIIILSGIVERSSLLSNSDSPGPTNGFWRDADWLRCRDTFPDGTNKWRCVEPGTCPLAPRFSPSMGCCGDPSIQSVASTQEARKMRLEGYGNAIVIPQAVAFIEAYLEYQP